MALLDFRAPDGLGFGRIEVGLVDDHGHGYAEVSAECRHPLEIMPPGGRGLHHGHGQGRARQRADHRTAHARGAVTESAPDPARRPARGLLLEQTDQAAGILLSGLQPGVHKGAEARFADPPEAAASLGKVNGPSRTECATHAAALAIQGVDDKTSVLVADRPEAAKVRATAALDAEILHDFRRMARNENFLRSTRGSSTMCRSGTSTSRSQMTAFSARCAKAAQTVVLPVLPFAAR